MQSRRPFASVDEEGQSLISILERYHGELDEAVGLLVSWSTASLSVEATLFASRDL